MLYHFWIELPINIRHALAVKFNLAKKHPTHVSSNRIVSDGYDMKEVMAAVTIESVQKLLNVTESDPLLLWEMLIKRAEENFAEPAEPVQPVASTPEASEAPEVPVEPAEPVKPKRKTGVKKTTGK